jgi:hypothetical protein
MLIATASSGWGANLKICFGSSYFLSIVHRIFHLVVRCVKFRAQISFHWFNHAWGAAQNFKRPIFIGSSMCFSVEATVPSSTLFASRFSSRSLDFFFFLSWERALFPPTGLPPLDFAMVVRLRLSPLAFVSLSTYNLGIRFSRTAALGICFYRHSSL